MATQWTPEQRAAIETRGGALLTAAAAGSGKTAVLVERVLRRLTDETHPVDIDRFLIVTYTRAAAAELRMKIADALSEAAAKAPGDARLSRQLFLTHRAQIETVHAFCQSLAREQWNTLGIASDFRIMDETESGLLMDEILDDVLEERYETADEGFLALSDLLTAGRDDSGLHAALLDTWRKLQSHPQPQTFLETVRAGFACSLESQTIGKSPAGQALMEEARMAADYGKQCLQKAARELTELQDGLTKAYLPAIEDDLQQAETLLKMLGGGDWDAAVAAAQSVSPTRLGAIRGYEDKLFQERIKALRELWKGTAKKIRENLLSITTNEAEEDRKRLLPAMNALADTVERFAAAYGAGKRERNLVDFSDLEHFAIELLTDDETGAPTALAKTLSARYEEILVDEYQDTNAVQDAIFHAVAREGGENLFMVGDVKQSIYSFRLANPYIFLHNYQTFTDVERAQGNTPRRVVLSKNFRSRQQVLGAVNSIFGAVMSETIGDLRYDGREALYLGADYPQPDDERYRTELCAVDLRQDENTDEDEDTPDKTEAEARAVAARLRRLLQEKLPIFDQTLGAQRPVRASDCVILLRSAKKKAAVYRAALEAEGIAAQTDDGGGLLASSEVQAVALLLSVIDNPRQDVELAGVLRAPLFGFSEQELAEIRLCDRKSSFYDALCLYAEKNEKAASFLRRLSAWRLLAGDEPVYRLIDRLYAETGALGLYGALPDGETRRRNLLAFFERAYAFEAQGYRGLFRFLHVLRGMLQSGQDFLPVQNEDTAGAVRIMTIHKSKGLEFPVVFLADCARQFNESDLREPVLVHEALGFGPKVRDLTRGIQYPSLWRQAIVARRRREQISEELRILYVAMTRAREKLIITCASARFPSMLQKWAFWAEEDVIPPYALGTARSSALWLLTPLLRHPAAGVLRELAGVTLVPDARAEETFDFTLVRGFDGGEPLPSSEEEREADRAADLTAQPDFVYPHAFLCEIPSKLTATGLKRGFRADEAAEGAGDAVKAAPEKNWKRPSFDRRLRGLTASEAGTAHHLFMQYANFAVCASPGGVRREIDRMAEKKILSPEQIAALQEELLCRFFASDVYKTLFQTGKVRREFKFSVLTEAERFYPDAAQTPGERVLLQGVIDCLIETVQGFTILDFKTDRVTEGSAARRAQEYRPQLDAYALAAGTIFGRPVVQKLVYFLRTGQSFAL